ncbi:phosphotransferase [Streptomyces sp. NPDC048558]|uniref:phosphotransferase family protein n=1 Tax=Streptomyces sp. NPDC048558 TaxID=3155759 RepID=UPI0033C5889A
MADPFAPASGLAPFLAAQRRLDRLGVRVPGLLLVDDSRRRYPADVAVVEDVAGGTLEALLSTEPARASDALSELAAMLDVMHQQHSEQYGRVDVLERSGKRGDKASGASCEQLVLERALGDLAEAAERDTRIGSVAASFHDRLRELATRVSPRTEHGLIHGELGPDHVLVNASGHPVLIDIDGLMFFDVEWEHVFLQLRFGDRYPALSRPGLDPARLDLFILAMRRPSATGAELACDGADHVADTDHDGAVGRGGGCRRRDGTPAVSAVAPAHSKALLWRRLPLACGVVLSPVSVMENTCRKKRELQDGKRTGPEQPNRRPESERRPIWIARRRCAGKWKGPASMGDSEPAPSSGGEASTGPGHCCGRRYAFTTLA